MLANHLAYYRLACLTGAFKIIAIDFQYCILSGIIRRTSNYIPICVWIVLICKGSARANIESINQSRIAQKEHLLVWNSETTQKPKYLSS